MPWHHDVNTELLAESTEGANAASVVALCQSAAMKAIQRIDVAADSQVRYSLWKLMYGKSVMLTAYSCILTQLIEMQDFLLALKSGNFEFSQQIASA